MRPVFELVYCTPYPSGVVAVPVVLVVLPHASYVMVLLWLRSSLSWAPSELNSNGVC